MTILFFLSPFSLSLSSLLASNSLTIIFLHPTMMMMMMMRSIPRIYHATEARLLLLSTAPDIEVGLFSPDKTGDLTLLLTNRRMHNAKITTSAGLSGKVRAKGFASGVSYDITQLERKYFRKSEDQIKDGLMKFANPIEADNTSLENNDNYTVEYYFDIFTDAQIDQKQACRGAELFNKDSYYIDLEFECDREKTCADDDDDIFYDIYGAAVEDPEICEDD